MTPDRKPTATLYALILLAAAFAAARAQDAPAAAPEAGNKPAIAVYAAAGTAVPSTTKDALAAFLLDALVNSGLYRTIERSETFLAEIDREQAKQRDGSVDDAQISRIGKQAGVRFVCAAAITPALGSYQVAARVIDVETADVTASGVADSPLKTLDDLKQVSAAVVYKMLGIRAKADQNFELLTGKEQTALEQSIQQSVRQTMQAKQPKRAPFWVGLSLETAGAGALGYGIYQEIKVQRLIDGNYFSKTEGPKRVRNVCYIAGAAALAAGISIHIFF